MSNEFVDCCGNKSNNMSTFLEAFHFGGMYVVAWTRDVVVGTHTVGNDHIFETAGLSDVVVLEGVSAIFLWYRC